MHGELTYGLANNHIVDPSRLADGQGPTPASEALLLADGTEIQIRPLTTRDRAGVAALFSRLSAESRYRRFLAPKRELTEPELAFFTDVDHVRHEALAAIDQRDGSIVGVARYIQYIDQPRVAAVAFEVADDRQRLGIGTALAQRLVDGARRSGLDRLSATTRWQNVPARALLRRLGFRACVSEGGELELDLSLGSSQQRDPLQPTPEPRDPLPAA